MASFTAHTTTQICNSHYSLPATMAIPNNLLLPLMTFRNVEFRAWRRRQLKPKPFLLPNDVGPLTQSTKRPGNCKVRGRDSGYDSDGDSNSRVSEIGEWILFTSPTSFNRFVLSRCPSISIKGGSIGELVKQERHYVRVDSGKIRVRSGDEIENRWNEKFQYQRVCVGAQDGGVICLDWPEHLDLTEECGLETTVLLIPGTAEGSMDGNVRSFAYECLKRGWFPIVMNPRGCAGSPLTTARLFTAADSDDVCSAIQFVTRARPSSVLMGIGWGHGSNMLTKYLAEAGEKTPLTAATCIDNPFDLDEATRTSPYSNTIDKQLTGGLIDILKSNKSIEGTVPLFSIPRGSIAENPFTSLLLSSCLPSNVTKISWCQQVTIEWLTAIELGLLKGHQPLLQDVDVTSKPSKGLALMEGRTSYTNGRLDDILNLDLLDSSYAYFNPMKETSEVLVAASEGETIIKALLDAVPEEIHGKLIDSVSQFLQRQGNNEKANVSSGLKSKVKEHKSKKSVVKTECNNHPPDKKACGHELRDTADSNQAGLDKLLGQVFGAQSVVKSLKTFDILESNPDNHHHDDICLTKGSGYPRNPYEILDDDLSAEEIGQLSEHGTACPEITASKEAGQRDTSPEDETDWSAIAEIQMPLSLGNHQDLCNDETETSSLADSVLDDVSQAPASPIFKDQLTEQEDNQSKSQNQKLVLPLPDQKTFDTQSHIFNVSEALDTLTGSDGSTQVAFNSLFEVIETMITHLENRRNESTIKNGSENNDVINCSLIENNIDIEVQIQKQMDAEGDGQKDRSPLDMELLNGKGSDSSLKNISNESLDVDEAATNTDGSPQIKSLLFNLGNIAYKETLYSGYLRKYIFYNLQKARPLSMKTTSDLLLDYNPEKGDWRLLDEPQDIIGAASYHGKGRIEHPTRIAEENAMDDIALDIDEVYNDVVRPKIQLSQDVIQFPTDRVNHDPVPAINSTKGASTSSSCLHGDDDENAQEKTLNTDALIVGAVTASLGASALPGSEEGLTGSVYNETSSGFSEEEHMKNEPDKEVVDHKQQTSVVTSLAEKAMSVAAPVVPVREDGKVDQDRLVTMLAAFAQRDGMLRLVGKLALLWGSLRGAMSLTDRLISFLCIAERPLPQRVLGFSCMVLILWSPVLVPLFPTLFHIWATNTSSKLVELACILGFYAAVTILIMQWGKRIRGHEYPLEHYGLNLMESRKIEDLFIGFVGGVMLVLSIQSANVLLGFVSLSWPSNLGPATFDVMGQIQVQGKVLLLTVRAILTATGIAFVEELLFRSWLLEEIAADLGYHPGIILSGLAFSLCQRSLQAIPGLWLLSICLVGARVRRQGSPFISIGLRTGILVSSYILQKGGYLIYQSNFRSWISGTHPFQPFSGIVGFLFAFLLAIVLYPRQSKRREKVIHEDITQ